MQTDETLSVIGRRLYIVAVAVLAVTAVIWVANYPAAPSGQPAQLGQSPFAGLDQIEASARTLFREQYYRCFFSERVGNRHFSMRCPVGGRLYFGPIAAVVLLVAGVVLSGIRKKAR